MDRRSLIVGVTALPIIGAVPVNAAGDAEARARAAKQKGAAPLPPSVKEPRLALEASGPLMSRFDGQVIENLDVVASAGHAITVVHRRVTIRNCRIRHAGGHGISGSNASELVLDSLEIDHVGSPQSGPGPSTECNNIDLLRCPGAIITRIKASRGASNVYLETCESSKLSSLELHDSRGPLPRGQNVQFNKCPDASLEDFSGENGPTSWTEDNVSVFLSDRTVVRRGLVSYNNGPTGVGVMLEGSFGCLVEDVDAVQQGNGAFAAVPMGKVGSGGCKFVRCRTRQSYMGPRDGRDAPSSNGLSIYTRISDGAERHTVEDCHYDTLANPKNLIWQVKAVSPGWSFSPRQFVPRPALSLAFKW